MLRSIHEKGVGRCWDCGYLLRGIESDRCPECGRDFDPRDPTTTNMGPDIGRLGRRLMHRPGWPAVAVMAAGVALVIWGTGWPYESLPRFEDRSLWLDWALGERPRSAMTARWNEYAVGVAIAMLAVTWMLLRLCARRLAIIRYRPPEAPRGGKWAMAVAMVLLLVGAWWSSAGGAKRIGREWANEELRILASPGGTINPPIVQTPVRRSDDRTLAAIRLLILHGDNARFRRTGIKFLIDHATTAGLEVLEAGAANERDDELLSLEIHLIGLYREEESAPLIEGFLTDARPSIRAAALDALGIIHRPAYPIGADGDALASVPIEIPGTPPINLRPILRRNQEPSDHGPPLIEFPFYTRQIELPATRRERLRHAMLNGPTLEEREAAARSLLLQPPSQYHLRIAEWGVWMGEGGDLKMAREIIDELPPFVHRTGNPISEMDGRVPGTMGFIVLKPVIHVTVSEPMSLDVEARIRAGRPWFCYPRPDDFEIETREYDPRLRSISFAPGGPMRFLDALDNAKIGTLSASDLRSGYPWALPHHRLAGPTTGFTEVGEMGVHWQSLIVSPTRLSNMHPPEVAKESGRWWSRLRDVNCSWVSNRGESERFLFYDGPTRLKLPTYVRLDHGTLRFERTAEVYGQEMLGPAKARVSRESDDDEPVAPPKDPPRWSMVVSVNRGTIRGQMIPPDLSQLRPFHVPPTGVEFRQQQVEEQLRRVLIERGLTESEAAGLLDCWRQRFFEADGMRVLMLLSPREYDAFCPMVVRPEPTEMARVGIVWTELGESVTPSTRASN